MAALLQLHHLGRWHDAGVLTAQGDERCRFDYLVDYVFARHAQPVALGLPVALQGLGFDEDDSADAAPRAAGLPAFLYDLIPQGRGRAHLLGLLNRSDSERLLTPLLLAGAFNPIGRLRISSAVAFYEEQLRRNPNGSRLRGFSIDDIVAKADAFLEQLSLHAMLSAGTTGVQGVAPKFLLAQDPDGLWFADLALPDERARRHWIVKLPRGRSDDDLLVHRHEAAYLRLAGALGLRTPGAVELHGRMLFTERFDRRVTADGVVRLHQESLASLAGLRGFGAPTTQNQLLAALRRHASDRAAETLEFLQRDVFNLALRNTDNHARNSAVQTLEDGRVRLTPLFDVAPMFRDPELIPRSVHWRDAAGRRLDDWRAVLDSLALADDERRALTQGLQAFGRRLEQLPALAVDHGVEPPILDACRASIEQQLEQLQRLSP